MSLAVAQLDIKDHAVSRNIVDERGGVATLLGAGVLPISLCRRVSSSPTITAKFLVLFTRFTIFAPAIDGDSSRVTRRTKWAALQGAKAG